MASLKLKVNAVNVPQVREALELIAEYLHLLPEVAQEKLIALMSDDGMEFGCDDILKLGVDLGGVEVIVDGEVIEQVVSVNKALKRATFHNFDCDGHPIVEGNKFTCRHEFYDNLKIVYGNFVILEW